MRITHDYMPDQGPQSYKDVTGRIIACKGGGGGGQAYYGNMDKLYGEQARAAQFMLDQSMPYLPGTMQNTAAMTSEAMSGQLGERARRQAGIDADAAAGDAINTMNQNLAGYGINPNSGLFAGQNRKLAVANAANKVGAMNQAGQWAEDQKWNRNAGQFGQLTGMSSGAMQGMSSAAGGFGQMAGQMSANDRANAAGYGQFGAAMASGLMKADGGYITPPKGLRLAAGGDVWSAYKRQNPIQAGGHQGGETNPLSSVVAGAAPHLVGKGLKMAWNSKMAEPMRNGVNAAIEGVKNSVGNAINGLSSTSAVEAGLGEGAQAAMLKAQDAAFLDAASSAAGNVTAETAAAAAGAEAAGASAAAGTAGAGAGAGLMAGAAAAAPWLIGGYLVGDALDLWADGGPVPHEGDARKDFTPGGKVNGPGTETSDSIPAWLSKGEYVLNAEAVKLVGKDKLDKVNQAGLAKREGAGARGLKQGQVALAGGGFLGGNLGVALGTGVNEWARQREMDEAEKHRNEALKLQQESLELSKKASGRADEELSMRKAAAEKALQKERLAAFALKAASLAKAGDFEALSQLGTTAYGDGHTHKFEKSQDGKTILLHRFDKTGARVDSTNLSSDPVELQRFILANADPSMVAQQDFQAAQQARILERYDADRVSRENMQAAALANAREVARIQNSGGPNAALQRELLQLSIGEKRRQIEDDKEYQQLGDARAAYLAALPKGDPGLRKALDYIDARQGALRLTGTGAKAEKAVTLPALKDLPKELQETIMAHNMKYAGGRSIGDVIGMGNEAEAAESAKRLAKAFPEFVHLVRGTEGFRPDLTGDPLGYKPQEGRQTSESGAKGGDGKGATTPSGRPNPYLNTGPFVPAAGVRREEPILQGIGVEFSPKRSLRRLLGVPEDA